MGWVIEDLVGTAVQDQVLLEDGGELHLEDGSGVLLETSSGQMSPNFTISNAPFPGSLTVIHNGLDYFLVANSPSGRQYSIDGVNITLGRSPNVGDDIWARYFIDA